MVLLKDVERFICVGPYTRCLPDFPHLDNEYDQVALIAFPMSIQNRDRDLVWLLCEDVDDLNSWMRAIVQTLPSHTLHMETRTNISSPTITDTVQNGSESNLTEFNGHTSPITKSGSIGFPLAAGLIATRLQGHTMNTQHNSLAKAGYDYGETTWGTGEGWGHFPYVTVPGYAGLGGSGCLSNHIDLIRNENDEQRLKAVEEQTGGIIDDEVAVEVAKYELNKESDDEDETTKSYHENKKDDSDDNEDSKFRQMKEQFGMIDDEEPDD